MTGTKRSAATAHYMEEAARWTAAGRPDHAAHLYAKALDVDPGDSRTRMLLAASLVDCEQPTAAATEYVKVARDYAANRSPQETLAIGHRILQLDPQSFTYSRMIDILQVTGREGSALCRRAARIHHAAGRDDEAAEFLRLCAQLDPSDTESWSELAQLYVNHEMPTEAAQALRLASHRLLSEGNNGRYVEFARAILTLEPRDLETLRELPRVLLRMGEPQRAVVELATLLRVNPGDVVGYETLAHAFAVNGQTTVSLSVLEQLTQTLATSGRREAAEAIVERAWSWRPDDIEFGCSVVALRLMQPSQPIVLDQSARPTTNDGTVVLSIADLTRGAQPSPALREDSGVFDATELVELVDQEDSVVLRLSDLSRVQRLPEDPETTQSLRYGQTPPREETQSLRYGQTAPPPETTQSLDLRDIIEMSENAISSREETLVGVAVAPRGGELEPKGLL